jgi:stearoyl-CoA desaturase (delta-9 desaturase)
MTRAHRNVNIAAVVIPFIAFLAAIPLLWNSLIGWTDLVILVAIYFATAFGITIGYHRMLTHRAFETYRPMKYLFAMLGSMAVQGDVISWVSDHRKHHAFTDEEGDPHSPHVGHGDGALAGLRGLYHAHVGWLFESHSASGARRFAPDLLEDSGMKRISKGFIPLVLLSLGLPFALGFLLTGELKGALTALLWGGLVRIFFLHHVTWSINSVCHFFGRRRFAVDDHSTNVFWLALPSLGESWHHNHHAFPRSAHHGMRWWEVDVSGLIILGMKKVGLARDVVTISREKQNERMAPRRTAEPSESVLV